MRNAVIPLLYSDPLAAASDTVIHLIATLPTFNRVQSLNALLADRLDLCCHLRRYSILFPHIVSVSEGVQLTMPSWWSSATGVTSLRFFCSYCDCIPNGAPSPCSCERFAQQALSNISLYWPNVTSLEVDQYVERTPQAVGLNPERPTSIVWPQLTNLKFAALHNPSILSSIIDGSASTLREVDLRLFSEFDLNVDIFPVCPNVTKLGVDIHLSYPSMQKFLSCFPAVTSLQLMTRWSDKPLISLDLAASSPRLEYLALQFYAVGSLPACVRALNLYNGTTVSSGCESLEALVLSGTWDISQIQTASKIAGRSLKCLQIAHRFSGQKVPGDFVSILSSPILITLTSPLGRSGRNSRNTLLLS